MLTVTIVGIAGLALMLLVSYVWRRNDPVTAGGIAFVAAICIFMACGESYHLGLKDGGGLLVLDSVNGQPLKVGVVYETLAVYPRQNGVVGYICLVMVASGDFRYYYFDKPLPPYFVKTNDGQYVTASPPKEEDGK